VLLAYTTADLARIFQYTERAIQKRAAKEQWPSLDRQGRGGGKAYQLPHYRNM